jgi:hypothetical protein
MKKQYKTPMLTYCDVTLALMSIAAAPAAKAAPVKAAK